MSAPSLPSNIESLTFGVEIETTIPRGLVSVGPYHAGYGVRTAPSFNGALWKAERDGSIMVRLPGHEACEFVSPVLRGAAGVAHLLEFVAWLNSLGARVNPSCGLHIHVGIEGVTGSVATEVVADYVAKLARVASFNATALYAQTGTLGREQGHYCAKPGEDYKRTVRALRRTKTVNVAAGISRYQMLNLTNVPRNHTVEFRCFAGTLNADKILAHLFSVLVLCRISAQGKTVPTWNNRPWTGTDAVWNLFKVRPVLRLVACPVFAERFRPMVDKALEMAGKYDLAKAGRPVPAE